MIEKIAEEVAKFSGLTMDELRNEGRKSKYVEPRQVAMTISYELSDFSLSEVGRFFGGRAHCTVINARKRVNNLLEVDKGFYKKWDKLIKKLKEVDYRTELQKERERICNKYIELFCKKHDLYFDYWVADIIGEVAAFGDYFFSFTDIVRDIDEDVEAGLILQWHDDSIEHEDTTINFRSYAMGLRYKEEAPN
jgi:hypothetical protein